jgi:tetratricopeptide (TPR) repeat protein
MDPGGAAAGRARRVTSVRHVVLLLVCPLLLVLGVEVAAAQTCDPWFAKVVSAQGSVEIRRAPDPRWAAVTLDEPICPGDTVHVGERSRAAILLRTGGVLRLNQNTTMSFPEQEEPAASLVSILRGVAHFLSRVPRTLRVRTPFVDGGVEGTEFLVEVAADRTTLTVFEGRVVATNDAGRLVVSSGESAMAVTGQAPVARVLVRPRDAVEWALHYPPVIDYRPADFPAGGWQELVRRSIEAYWRGDLRAALAILQGAPAGVGDPRFFTYRGALLLTVGRVDEAGPDLERALTLDPTYAPAIAVQSIIAVVQNRKPEALRLARRAIELGPEIPAAWVGLSYAQQADFDLDGALASVERAVKLDAGNALAWARLAELRLSLGNLKKALDAARTAVKLNPQLARTQVVLGFAYVTQIKVGDAKRAFEAAIRLDSAEPLARLGLGLATIRGGDLKAGRQELEIAASLDPNRSLVRSYLGKAYYDERRDGPAEEELATAKTLDPRDPTPWLYDAIRKQSVTRPVEALEDLQTSIELNDNRAIYRSRLQLDEDLAVRSSSLARIYDDLGFEQLALAEGWRSLNVDPANYSAHRFLADTYASRPRHEIARVSELLQAQLLQPINIRPVQPQVATSQLFVLSSLALTSPSYDEYSHLYERNRLSLLATGIAGSNSTLSDELALSGVLGPLSFSAGQFHFETDGFRQNNDLRHDIYGVFVQLSVTPRTSVQAEYRSNDSESGDLTLRFDPGDFSRTFRDRSHSDTFRVGLHHSLASHSDIIASLIYRRVSQDISFSGRTVFEGDDEGYLAEAQHLFRSTPVGLITGAGHSDVGRESRFPPFPGTVESRVRHTNAYVYSLTHLPAALTVTLGLSGDFLEGAIVDRNQVNPKVGVTWLPFPHTTLRAAVFRTLERTLISAQTIEPTQVAGFNQFFADGEGTDAWRYGVGIDQKAAKNLYVGAEGSRRELSVPGLIPGPAGGVIEARWDEWLARAYVYWTPHPWLALSGDYEFERVERHPDFFNLGLQTEIETHRIPLGIGFFHPSGLMARVKVTYVNQRVAFRRQRDADAPPGSDFEGGDAFVIVDPAVGYRFPKRLGEIAIEATNVFDERFRFQDTDPANPRLIPERLVLGRVTVTF